MLQLDLLFQALLLGRDFGFGLEPVFVRLSLRTAAALPNLIRAVADSHRAMRIDGITRESFAIFERQTGQQYRFILPVPCLRPRDQERCLDTLTTEIAGASFLVASGSLPRGVPADFYSRVRELAQRHGLRFVLDTSGPALAGGGIGHFLIKTSLRELEELAGRELKTEIEEEQAARAMIAEGRAEILVLSLGARGALLATAGETRRFPAIPITAAAGSVGAGDSMVAGIVLSLARGWTLIEAVKFGIAAGAGALLRPGTELCPRDDTERLYATVLGQN